MKLSNKRQADEELKPARVSKRKAATPAPTTRMTRSAYKQLIAKNASAAELNPGLSTTPRQRKEAVPSISSTASPSTTCLTHGQQLCTPPTSLSGSSMELEMLPATTYVPPSQPTKQHSRPLSVIYALSATPDGQKICAPIRMGSASNASTKTPQSETAAVHPDAANPGGPAPIANMNGPLLPLTISYNTRPESVQTQNPRRRRPSGSELISPLSGPVQQPCAPPAQSRISRVHMWDSSPADPVDNGFQSGFEAAIMLYWKTKNIFHPGWIEGFVDNGDENMEMNMEYCKAPEDMSAPAITEATYSVGSFDEAAELFENDMVAQAVEQCSELPVVDIPVTKSPTDIFHEEMYFAQMTEDTTPNVEYDAAAADIDAMEWVPKSEVLETSGPGHQGPSGNKRSAEHVEALLSSSSKRAKLDFSANSFAPSERAQEFAASTTPAQRRESFRPSPANLLREKELKARLIASRKARRHMQNILVRAPDGTLSIASADQASAEPSTWSSQWQMDEDHYSVEEYDEDTVSY